MGTRTADRGTIVRITEGTTVLACSAAGLVLGLGPGGESAPLLAGLVAGGLVSLWTGLHLLLVSRPT